MPCLHEYRVLLLLRSCSVFYVNAACSNACKCQTTAAFLGYEMGYDCDHLTPGVWLCCYWLFSPCRAEGGMRRGNMGHLTRIANAVVQNMEKGPMQTQISEFIKGIISFLHSIVFSLTK